MAAADGPAGNPTQAATPVRHTVKIDKDALLQDYGFHISESLPLTVVAVTAGRVCLENVKGVWFLGAKFLGSPPISLSCNEKQKMLPQEVRKF